MKSSDNNTSCEYNHPNYINVPYFVLQDERLDFFNKFLFSLFWSFSLCGKKIKTSNGYLATLFKVSDKYIQMRLKDLEDLKLIRRHHLKHKRFIEVLYVPKHDIEIEDISTKTILSPTTVTPSTEIVLQPTTVGTPHQPQLVPPPTTVGTDIKDYNKEDIKRSTHTDEPVDNFFLETSLYLDSEQQRKAIVLRQLCLKHTKAINKHASLNSDKTYTEVIDECVAHYATQPIPQLVSPQRLESWINKETVYKKEQEISKLKYPTKEEHAANELKIRERELKAQEDKRIEKEAAKGFNETLSNLQRTMGFAAAKKKDEEEMTRLGLSANDYYSQIFKKVRTG